MTIATMKSFEKATDAFVKKVKTAEGHSPVVTYVDTREGSWGCYLFSLSCACGWNDQTRRTGKNGDILTYALRTYNNHITPDVVITEPILIAKVHKTRVTHEVWVFHKSHDQPTGLRGYNDWNWYIKRSNGWSRGQGGRSYEAAQAAAASYVEKQEGLYTVEWVENGHLGVEAPVSTVVTAAAKLVADAKTLRNPVALRDHLKLVDEGITQLHILEALKVSIEERLYAHMDLGL
jgi:hypothetical protein